MGLVAQSRVGSGKPPASGGAGSTSRKPIVAGRCYQQPPSAATRLAPVLIAGGVLAGATATAYGVLALWQLSALMDRLIDSVSASARAVPAQFLSLPPADPPRVVNDTGGVSRAAAYTEAVNVAKGRELRARGEASEQPIPVGLQTWPHYLRIDCGEVFVYIVTVFEQSPWDSVASLALGKTAHAKFRRAGQALGEWEVLAITEDWTGLNPAVWLSKEHEICRAELSGNPLRVQQAQPVPAKRARYPRPRQRRRRR